MKKDRLDVREYIESSAISIREEMKEDLENENIEGFFDKFQGDKRTLSFISYYNKTVLNKERIQFSKFTYQWALHLSKDFYAYFDKNYDKLVKEIKKDKNIEAFFKKHCVHKRKEGSFCSKLFHTILPSEFPPVDNPIKGRFNLQNEEFITSVLIIKRGYELFIKENPRLINLIRATLLKDKFSYLRVNELSDIRILDMYYWFKENREKK